MTELLYLNQEDDDIELKQVVELVSLDALAEEFAAINTQAFHLSNSTTPEEGRTKLEHADLYVRAYRSSKLVGFALYQLIPSALGSVIYQSRGILPEAQGMGLGRVFPQTAVSVLKPTHFIAKAQNPISIWSTMQSGIMEKVCPIEEEFGASNEMQQLLLDTIKARGKVGEVDLSNGLHRSSYSMGKLGDYSPKQDHAGTALVQKKLKDIGVDVLNGDAIYYGGRIKENAKRSM